MQTIVWDVDDVLNDLMRVWFEEHWLKTNLGSVLSYQALKENPPDRILGIRRGEYLASLDEFRTSGAYERLLPRSEILEWFRRSGHQFRHMALSAVPLQAAHVSAAWVMKHFGFWIRSFHFVPSSREGAAVSHEPQTKKDFLAWWGKADLLVEDSPEHIRAAQAAGIRTVIAPQPWNEGCGTLEAALRQLQ